VSGPWEIWNRIMTVVGTIATVGGLGVGVYSVIVPGTLPSLLEQILTRMQAEPTLADTDRVGIQGAYCSADNRCTVFFGKYDTTHAMEVAVEMCDANGVRHSERKSYGMYKAEGSNVAEVDFPFGEDVADVRLIVTHGSDIFTVITPLRVETRSDTYVSWTASSIPQVTQGEHTCPMI
jgi:hypothetical protein